MENMKYYSTRLFIKSTSNKFD